MTKKDRYIYPAIFDYAEDGISITFPDLPGCISCGQTDEEALMMAKDALEGHLYVLEEDNDVIPTPTPANKIVLEKNQVVVLIDVWMPLVRDEMENRAIKKTLTLPKWLNDLAQHHQVNFSHILQEALKKRLGIDEKRKRSS